MAKYLATSLAMEKVVSEPRVMRSCLPISTTSISLVGLESRSTMLPASLAAVVPVFMATPTSAWARAGASLVPSPVMATSFPPSCSALISAILASGVASARKSSTPASSAMAAAVSGLSPVIITVRMPIERISANFSWMPCLDHVLELDDPEDLRTVGHDQRRGPGPRRSARRCRRGRRAPCRPARLTHCLHRLGRPLADLAAVEVEPRHPGRGREGHEGVLAFELALPDVEALLGQHHDGTALGRLVGQRRQLGRVGQVPLGVAPGRIELPTPSGCPR